MKMFGLNAANMDKRKKELIELMSEATGADLVLPMQDRVIAADLVMSGVEKVFQTIETHMDLSANVMPNPTALEALFIMMMQEAARSFSGIIEQRAQHHAEHIMAGLTGEHRYEIDQMTEELKAMGFNVLSGDELMAKLREMGHGQEWSAPARSWWR